MPMDGTNGLPNAQLHSFTFKALTPIVDLDVTNKGGAVAGVSFQSLAMIRHHLPHPSTPRCYCE